MPWARLMAGEQMNGKAELLRSAAAIVLSAGLCAAGLAAAAGLRYLYAGPTVEEYLAAKGPQARLVPAGELSFDGRAFACGRYPAVLNAGFEDYAGAYFGFIIINPKRFETLPLIVKLYAYTHECGHQYMGRDETQADCFAIRRGRQEGWLDEAGLQEICNFIGRSKGDALHLAGRERCALLRRCYHTGRPGKEAS